MTAAIPRCSAINPSLRLKAKDSVKKKKKCRLIEKVAELLGALSEKGKTTSNYYEDTATEFMAGIACLLF